YAGCKWENLPSTVITMAPVPLEGHHTSANNLAHEGSRGGSISLGLLMDFIIQRTYHEITVLAELLPRKTDMERKVEIYNFSARTRQLFIRLLALVKWASSATKVEKSAHIMAFLDKQSLLFIDTADILSRMARETLVHARLPNFHLPAAIEVLTSGTYNKLPSCIRERIVPPGPISTIEKRDTLQKLNRVIQHRLVTRNLLPQMKNFEIDSGQVTFKIEQEFNVSLTVMGDGFDLPWRILDLSILVSDRETGDGRPLVHNLQTNYILQIAQARILDSCDPLLEVYHVLHSFCQSLQLEVLYSQALRLIRDRLNDFIRIDKYAPGHGLCISYWRELSNRDSGSELGYKLDISVDEKTPANPLVICHTPSLSHKDCDSSDLRLACNQLSMEYLLVHAIYVRTKNRLSDLKQELQNIFKGIECTTAGSPAILSVPILQPCLRAELLLIAVDTHTGMLQCHIPQYNTPLIREMNLALNEDRSKLPGLVSKLRYWIIKKRCAKTLQHLPATCHGSLPLLLPPEHFIKSTSSNILFIKFHKHPLVVLIASFKENPTLPREIQYTFHLCSVKACTIDSDISDDGIDNKTSSTLKFESYIEFDSFVVTHGSYTNIDADSNDTDLHPVSDLLERLNKKRRTGNSRDPNHSSQSKKPKSPAYFIPELAHVVALCDEQIPFVMLAQELTKRGIAHQGLQIEANATALVLKLVHLPSSSAGSISKVAWNALLKRLLSVAIRIHGKGSGRTWLVEFVFYGSPVASLHPKEQGLRRPVHFQYDMGTTDTIPQMVDSFLRDWVKIVHLYGLVHDFSENYRSEEDTLHNFVSVKSYDYNKLMVLYGPSRRANVTVQWDSRYDAFRLYFCNSITGSEQNSHSILKEQLESALNKNKNLAQIMHILNETLQPVTSLCRLSRSVQLGLYEKRAQVPISDFILLPQCMNIVRVTYQNLYCLEVCLRGHGMVSLRDGAYSRFDHSFVVEGFTPIQGLSTFLSQYADKTVVHRKRSQSEDDNPPSPLAVDTASESNGVAGSLSGSIGNFPSQHSSRGGAQSPALQTRDSARFHPPLTPPSGSNPNTPASPHTVTAASNTQTQGSQQQQNYSNSPGMALNLASPTSLASSTPNVLPHPSPNSGLVTSPLSQMHVPSPAGLMATSSPGPTTSNVLGQSSATSGSFLQQQQLPSTSHMNLDNSPFPSSQSMASPATSNWTGSPSISRPSPARPGQSPIGSHISAIHSPQPSGCVNPSGCPELQQSGGSPYSSSMRILPQRSWAGAIPIILTYEALDLICSRTKQTSILTGSSNLSPLERFLGCAFMRRQLQRFIQTGEGLSPLDGAEPGVIHFKTDLFQCRVSFNTQHMQTLLIKIQPSALESAKHWNTEELQLLERFFESRVVSSPYKPNNLLGFIHILSLPLNVLKDFVQLIRLELISGLAQQQQFKWTAQLCLRVPPSAIPIVPCGMPAIMQHKLKILFYLQVTRAGTHCGSRDDDSLPLVLPLIYDVRSNLTQLANERDAPPGSVLTMISVQLKRFAEYGASSQECSIFPTVRYLLLNLVLPFEVSGPQSQQQQQQSQPQMSA
ncbi:hypothetical protein QAD02_020515, partial [Eretmocerus hayati]